MPFALPDPDTAFGAQVAHHLAESAVAWMTVVDGSGTPQPAPIWFLWEGESALIYSDGKARRLDHLRANPKVSLNFDGNGRGGDIVVLTGTVADAPDEPAVPDNPAYLAKYGSMIGGGSWGTPEVFAETFSVPLRFHPSRVRGHG